MLDDEKVPAGGEPDALERVERTVAEVAAGINEPGLRAAARLQRLLLVRLPADLPGQRGLTGRSPRSASASAHGRGYAAPARQEVAGISGRSRRRWGRPPGRSPATSSCCSSSRSTISLISGLAATAWVTCFSKAVGGLLELGRLDGDADHALEPAEQRQAGLRVGDGGGVVGDGGPEARGAHAALAAGAVEDAEDAGRALVGDVLEAELLDQPSSVARPVIGTGRVWATSAISEPKVTTDSTPQRSATSRTELQKVRQRVLGSVPLISSRSRSASSAARRRRGCRATRRRASAPSVISIVGRLAWKSKNSSGSIWAISSVSSEARDRAERGAGGAGGVVPAREGGDEHRRAQLRRLALPDDRIHRGQSSDAPCRGPVRRRPAVRIGIASTGGQPTRPPANPADESGPRGGRRAAAGHGRSSGRFAVVRKDRQQAKSGTPYLSLELRDRTGSIPARIFREADQLGARFERGDAIEVRGKVERFRGGLSAEITALRRIEPGSFDPAEFLPVRLPLGRGARRASSST